MTFDLRQHCMRLLLWWIKISSQGLSYFQGAKVLICDCMSAKILYIISYWHDSFKATFCHRILQQNNVWLYSAHDSTTWLRRHRVHVLYYPACRRCDSKLTFTKYNQSWTHLLFVLSPDKISFKCWTRPNCSKVSVWLMPAGCVCGGAVFQAHHTGRRPWGS